MFTVDGMFNTIKVFTDDCEQTALNQIMALANNPHFKQSKIRMMPDVHSGAGCVIGTTMTVHDKVVPNLVGVDIGCGVLVVQMSKLTNLDFKKLDRVIRNKVPAGKNIHIKTYAKFDQLYDMVCAPEVNLFRAELSIGTLGGGNHFIELDKDNEDNYYLLIHSGSRHLGVEVCNYYQNLAWETLNGRSKQDKKNLIERFKAEGREKDIQKALENLSKLERTDVTKDMAYLEGNNLKDYLHDIAIVQAFAVMNRLMIADIIINEMDWHPKEMFQSIHNYIDVHNMILRKGAISAREGEKIIIPLNMRDGALICKGKGNPDWNYSAPHGAGRIMSRSQARKLLSETEYKDTMQKANIYTTSANASTIDEAPMAYKAWTSIEKNIYPTVEIINHIRPVYNFKAGEE